jgi:hypothetical protein
MGIILINQSALQNCERNYACNLPSGWIGLHPRDTAPNRQREQHTKEQRYVTADIFSDLLCLLWKAGCFFEAPTASAGSTYNKQRSDCGD